MNRFWRIAGSSLIILGTLILARTIWLGAMYYQNISLHSQRRFFILLVLAPSIASLGVWILKRKSPT